MTTLIILTSFNTLILVSMVLIIGYCVYLDYKNKQKQWFGEKKNDYKQRKIK